MRSLEERSYQEIACLLDIDPAAAGAGGDAMMRSRAETASVRNLPHVGTRHEDHDELFPRDSGSLRGLRHDGRTVSTNRQHPLVVHDHQLSEMFRVLLHFGR